MRLKYSPPLHAPWVIPLAIAIVLFLGSFTNNELYQGSYIDSYLTGIWLGLLVFYYVRDFRRSRIIRKMTMNLGRSIDIESALSVRVIAVIIQLASLYHYTVAGVPLFSVDPDSARIEFMQSTVTFKVLKVFLPFFIIYYLSWILLNPKRRIADFLLMGLMIFQYSVSGGKGAVIWVLVFLFLATNLAGYKIKVRTALLIGGLGLLITLALFKIVAGIEDLGGALLFFYDRLTSIAEFGLFVSTQKLGEDFSNLAPLNFVVNLFEKYVNHSYEGFTPSLGREVTAYFYGGDVYGYLWELTVTMLGDFYILAGLPAVVIGCIVYIKLMRMLWRRSLRAKNLYRKVFFITLWFHLVLYSLTGSIVTEFFVRTAPFVVFWVVGRTLIKFLSPEKRRLVSLAE